MLTSFEAAGECMGANGSLTHGLVMMLGSDSFGEGFVEEGLNCLLSQRFGLGNESRRRFQFIFNSSAGKTQTTARRKA